uniref:Uncharacterized protein n=1 Tax=Acrobeloides nanus TaxID=290746 RepID=A0A914CV73_9BILA
MKHGTIVQIVVARCNAMTMGNDAQEMFNSWIVDVEMKDHEVKSVVVKNNYLVKPISRKRNPKRENMKKNKPGTSKGASKEIQKDQGVVEDSDKINALSYHLAELADDDFAKEWVSKLGTTRVRIQADTIKMKSLKFRLKTVEKNTLKIFF